MKHLVKVIDIIKKLKIRILFLVFLLLLIIRVKFCKIIAVVASTYILIFITYLIVRISVYISMRVSQIYMCDNFNKKTKIEQLNIIFDNDNLNSENNEYKDICKKILYKYKDCDINDIAIEKARIKQYFIGDRKKRETSNFLFNITTSAIFGSLLGALLSVFFSNGIKLSEWDVIFIWIATPTLTLPILDIFLRKANKDTYNKDEYYNLVLEILNRLEKQRECEKLMNKNL
ncbi:hypothetical protein SNUCP5_15590 [Clostridium perfringens A]|uniref:hypothetical protein n=1 Tax=Clostridium perfringens TaxID=1502 RepID=UPI00399D22AE